MTGYVDTHCHLDQYPSPVQVWQDAAAAGVVTVAMTELPSTFRVLATRFGRRERLRLALGFHPLRMAGSAPSEPVLFHRLLSHTDYVGEIGLDFSQRGRASRDLQIKLFERLLDEPEMRRKVVSVHSRRAEQAAIDRLAAVRVHAILHWYTGPLRLIDQALGAGLYFSINPAMLRSAHGQQVIAAVPPERVVTETDGPYTRSSRGPAQPADIPTLVERLAALWHIESQEARQRIWTNVIELHQDAAGGN